MVIIHRKEHFNAAHKLFNPDWSKEKNEEVFGECANEYWHGHNFELTVSVAGDPDPETGFVMDLKDLSGILKEHVIDKLDHKNLNMDVEFMKGKMASCEVLITEIWNILEPRINAFPSAKLHKLHLKETENNFVEYMGPSTRS